MLHLEKIKTYCTHLKDTECAQKQILMVNIEQGNGQKDEGKSPVKWERNHEIRNRGNRRGARHERVELERGIFFVLIKMKPLSKDKIKNSMLQCPLL